MIERHWGERTGSADGGGGSNPLSFPAPPFGSGLAGLPKFLLQIALHVRLCDGICLHSSLDDVQRLDVVLVLLDQIVNLRLERPGQRDVELPLLALTPDLDRGAPNRNPSLPVHFLPSPGFEE